MDALYIWGPASKIIYSKNKVSIGKSLSIDGGLAGAYSGKISSELIKPSADILQRDLLKWDTLIESQVLILLPEKEKIGAVAEFFYDDRRTKLRSEKIRIS